MSSGSESRSGAVTPERNTTVPYGASARTETAGEPSAVARVSAGAECDRRSKAGARPASPPVPGERPGAAGSEFAGALENAEDPLEDDHALSGRQARGQLGKDGLHVIGSFDAARCDHGLDGEPSTGEAQGGAGSVRRYWLHRQPSHTSRIPWSAATGQGDEPRVPDSPLQPAPGRRNSTKQSFSEWGRSLRCPVRLRRSGRLAMTTSGTRSDGR